jgi:SAM-dependent methyltransferase
MKTRNSNLKQEINKVKIMVDWDKNLTYETHNWITKVIRAPMMLFLNVLPISLARTVFLAFSGPNGDTRTVFRSVGTHKALEVMYTYPERRKQGEVSLSDSFWENFLSNARAIRNRLILVKKELLKAIKEVVPVRNDIKLLSLGSGSARAVFEAANVDHNQNKVKIKLIDMSRKAINFSRELARSYNINQLELHRDYAQNIKKYCNNFQPDVVEMVGLLDYFYHDQAVDLIKKIYEVLIPGGCLITCNICPNLESPFVTKGINWPLIYREPEELAELLIQGGFSPENFKLKYEPLKIHCLAIAKK